MSRDGCSRWKRLLCAVAAAVLGGASSAASSDRFALAQVEVTGPVRELVARGSGGSARLEGSFVAGERVRVTLALPLLDTGPQLAPELSWRGEGRATFAGWDSEAAQERSARWSASPLALQTRPVVAPPMRSPRRAPRSALGLAAAGVLLALSARARPRLAVTCAVAATAAAVAVFAGQRPQTPLVRLIEVDGRSGAGLAIDCASSELRGARADDLRWECDPPLAVLTAGAARSTSDWTLGGRAVQIRVYRPFEVLGRRLAANANQWGLLAPVWRRSPSGDWQRFDAWPLGAELPDVGGEVDAGPPGWINPALPLGVSIVTGRWEDAPRSGPSTASEVWVRWIGP